MKNAKGSYVGKTAAPQFQTYPTTATTPHPPAPAAPPAAPPPTMSTFTPPDFTGTPIVPGGLFPGVTPPTQAAVVDDAASVGVDPGRARLVNAIMGGGGGVKPDTLQQHVAIY